jgi:Ca-activated chloride channel family protein
MRRFLPVLGVLLVWGGAAHARGLLIPEDKTLPPLAMLNHKVSITLEDQVAVTKVEQTFRNHTNRELEATYVFPVPKGASVNKFTMLVNGKEVTGELIEAAKAKQVYNSLIRRTQDPGLLEYIGNNLLQVKVFPIPANGDQKMSLSYTAVANKDGDVIEYIYPLKTDGKATATLEDFGINAAIKSQHAIQNIYSPTHAIDIKRINDKEVQINFQRNQGLLDTDFQLFYSLGEKDVGLTTMMHRPVSTENGYFTMLITPKVEIPKEYQVPRDMVLVLDTSGSMQYNGKLDQAKKALNYVLGNLTSKDRFAMMNFSTGVTRYKDSMLDAGQEQIAAGKKWVDKLQATGGTAIDAALKEALALRAKDSERTFTIVFFTDGMPTVGETKWEKIVKNVEERNNANTRIFTFGVGDDVNATFLDTLAEQTRAVSTYVRPAEDIEAKVSALYSKISNPVLANLKLKVGSDISLSEVYPPELPDLFHGGQLVVMGRFTGKGPAAITLTGAVGKEYKEFIYETTFPDKTGDDKDFIEHLWARRKVGYLLDQIRANGDKKELVDEVILLAKKYGITTPYTSYLIVPDGAVPVVGGPSGKPLPPGTFGGVGGFAGGGLAPPALRNDPKDATKTMPVTDFVKGVQKNPGDVARRRAGYEDEQLDKASKNGDGKGKELATEAAEKKQNYDKARELFAKRDRGGVQGGKLGVDLSIQTNNLRNQSKLDQTASRMVFDRTLIELGGVWIDEGFDPNMPTLTVKAQSDAYFHLLDLQPRMTEVFRLGNHLVWVTPSGTALVIDTVTGKEKLSDEEINKLFVAKK